MIELTEQQIDEAFKAFDENKTKYPPISLKPKDAIQQAFGFNFPGTDQFVLYLASYTDKGTKHTPTKLRAGEDIAQAIPLSISDKGTLIQLKGGLGVDPIGAISSIFDAAYSTILKHNIKAVMFRFPQKKMKGQGRILTRVMSRLVMRKTAGKFEVMATPISQSDKYAFVFIVKKSQKDKVFSKLEIDLGEFTKIDVGGMPVYKDSKGNEVTIEEAKLASVTKKVNKIPTTVVPNIHVSKAELAKMYALGDNSSVPAPNNNASVVSGAKNDTSIKSHILSPAKGSIGMIIEEMFDDYDTYWKGITSTDAVKLVAESKIEENLFKGSELIKSIDKLCSFGNPTEKEKILRVEIVTQKITDTMLDQKDVLVPEYNTKPYYDVMDSTGYKALVKYSGTMNFKKINDTLLGRQETKKPDPTTLKEIEKLDKEFIDNGVILPEGTAVYRGQKLPEVSAQRSFESKTFYFANFVSTSLMPIMFHPMHFAKIRGITIDGKEAKEIKITRDDNMPDDYNTNTHLGFIINNVHETKVLNTLYYPINTWEMEIVLPRGTILRFDKVTEAGKEGRNYLIESSVITNLVEGEVLYNGDLFMETGKVEPLNFKSFITEARNNSDKSIRTLMADLIDLDILPERFVE